MTEDTIHLRLKKLEMRSLIAGVIFMALVLVGACVDIHQFFISYLFAYLFWLGLALGCLGFLMTHHLTGGRWGFPVRRFYEAAAMTLPLMALLFIPICFGLRHLYLWTNPHIVAADPVLQHRSHYMTISLFIIRAAVFFIFWSIAAVVLNRLSLRQDTTQDVEPTRKLRTLSGPGILLYPVTATFVLVDWVLSLEPDWFSTMFLVLIVIGQMLSGLAFSIILLAWLHRKQPLAAVVNSTTFHHLGMLLFAFIMLWTYLAFSQLLIIYSGNLPHEIVWYEHRVAGDWKVVVWFIILFHFAVPFFLLLSRSFKKNARILATFAAIVLFAHIVDVYWLVEPSFSHGGVHLHWLDFAATIGLGGIWLAAFASRLNAHPLLVRNDPRQEEAIHGK
ncbi:MAG TPA: hypothetical protein VHY22_01360 [Chthoniobacteraceae bacterium]|nr:hypothetical protein [Chthoniobacteraceae bacterium]